MFLPLPTPKEMAHWDKLSIEDFGIKGEILMENASREALNVLLQSFGDIEDKKAVFFAGSGNNGGDAFALARHMSNLGCKCLVLHSRNIEQYKGETAYHIQLLIKSDIPMNHLSSYNLDNLPAPDIIVDGLLGTGFQGTLREDYLHWIQIINKLGQKCLIFSLDIPSGLNGLTGKASPEAVKADYTVTFGAAKTGLFMPEAANYVGQLEIKKIGIPIQVEQQNSPACFGLNQEVFSWFPQVDPLQHKGKAGHLLIIGGSPGLTGAPTLAALGALRAGSGLVTVACPKELSPEIKAAGPEIMTLPLDSGSDWTNETFSQLQPSLANFDAVVLGPGLGRKKSTQEFCQAYLQTDCPPTVLDADALFCLANIQNFSNKLRSNFILTPHPGEMSRLAGTSIKDIQVDRLEAARNYGQSFGCVLVLKGAGTVIFAPEDKTFISPFSTSNLAIGGAGDVLSGIIGSLLARGLSPEQAACLGVYWHGLAGQELETSFPFRGNLAREIAEMLPKTVNLQES